MSKSSTRFTILAGLLSSLTCTACGRVALTPRLQQEGEYRAFVIGINSRPSARAVDESELDGFSGSRLVRSATVDDSSIQDARATRSGWAASDVR